MPELKEINPLCIRTKRRKEKDFQLSGRHSANVYAGAGRPVRLAKASQVTTKEKKLRLTSEQPSSASAFNTSVKDKDRVRRHHIDNGTSAKVLLIALACEGITVVNPEGVQNRINSRISVPVFSFEPKR